MAAIEACQSSLENGYDWIGHVKPQDLGNGLVRGGTHQKSGKLERS